MDVVPSAAELAVADDVGTQLTRLVRLTERLQAARQTAEPDGIERATYHLLVHLVKDGPQRAGSLAEIVHSDPSTVSRQIAHLCKLGYVERTADPDDGRATLIAATAEGERVFEQNRHRRAVGIATMLASWQLDERVALADLLGRFVTAIEDYKSSAHAGHSERAEKAERNVS